MKAEHYGSSRLLLVILDIFRLRFEIHVLYPCSFTIDKDYIVSILFYSFCFVLIVNIDEKFISFEAFMAIECREGNCAFYVIPGSQCSCLN